MANISLLFTLILVILLNDNSYYFITKQKKISGECNIWLTLFFYYYTMKHKSIQLDKVSKLDNETYIKIDEVDADSQDTSAYMLNSYTYTWENVPYDFLRAKKYEIKIKMIDVSDNEIDIMSFLPVELTYFEVSQQGEELFFEWETATETNNDYFTIEQSLDGVSFHEIARITGAGTTSSYTLYEYSYPISIEGIVYFRLKQTDYNGDYSYSNIKTIDVVGNSPLRMYPIPALAYITIEGDYESVQFVDVNGVIHTPHRAEGNTYPLTSFPKGMFFAIVTLKNGEIVTRQFLHK